MADHIAGISVHIFNDEIHAKEPNKQIHVKDFSFAFESYRW